MRDDIRIRLLEEAYECETAREFIDQTGWMEWMEDYTSAEDGEPITEREAADIDAVLTEIWDTAHTADEGEIYTRCGVGGRCTMDIYAHNGVIYFTDFSHRSSYELLDTPQNREKTDWIICDHENECELWYTDHDKAVSYKVICEGAGRDTWWCMEYTYDSELQAYASPEERLMTGRELRAMDYEW